MHNLTRTVFTLLSAMVLLVLASEPAQAIPAFARKYRMSCKTCHYPFPRLKPYGDDFAGNGFNLPDQEAPRYYDDTGDDMLSLIRDFPVAVRLEGYLNYNDTGEKKSDIASPYLLKLLSGGAISDKISYYFYFYMDERGEVAGVEDAYVMFNNLLGADFDIYLGQFQISDPLFKRELRLSYEDYQVYRLRVGDSQKNLTYDRGIMLTLGLESGTDLIFEVINGNGLSEADSDRNFDNDKYKDFFGRISQEMGDFFRIGAFGYSGRERSGGILNKVWMAGPDLTVSVPGDKFELNFQYLFRSDDNPLFSGPAATEIKTRGMLAEAVILPRGDESRVVLSGIANWVNSDLDEHDYQSFSAHISYLARRNFRLAAEFTHEWEHKTNRLGLAFITAF
ncbi:MAG: hypothetical protein V1794_13105 [Candidatus Glassbacteria bacterium]